MLENIKSLIKAKMHKRKMHKQFLNVQKWQKEMFIEKLNHEKH